jgi:hypothetical protein
VAARSRTALALWPPPPSRIVWPGGGWEDAGAVLPPPLAGRAGVAMESVEYGKVRRFIEILRIGLDEFPFFSALSPRPSAGGMHAVPIKREGGRGREGSKVSGIADRN